MPDIPSAPSDTTDGPLRPPTDTGWRDRLLAIVERVGVDLSPLRLAVAAIAVVGAVVAAFIVLRPSAAVPPPDDTLPRASATVSSSTAPSAVKVGTFVVQAAGAVMNPGVYTVASTARVNDLITLAGGFADGADPDQVELAAVLTDGERVYVPKLGEAPPPAPSAGATGTSSSHGLVDLNHAGEADLESLPGIGPSLAQAIIDHRTQHGAFTSVDDLGDVRGIGPAKLEQLRPLVKV